MAANEPDTTPVNQQHIADFLAWYRLQVQGPARDIAFAKEWWFNALRSLTLGQLREGIRCYRRFDSKLMLSPVEFHGLCTGTKDERAIAEFHRMREMVRNAPEIPTKKQQWKQEYVRPRIKTSNDDQ